MKSPFAIIRKYQKTLMVALTLLAVFAFVIADSLVKSIDGARPTDEVQVETNAGDLKKSDLDALIQQRQLANSFIQRAAAACEIGFDQIQRFMFFLGADNDVRGDVLFGHLLSLKADEIDLVITDSTVQNFISQVTQNKLSTQQFRQVVDDLGTSQKAVFEALRGEIRVKTAMQLFAPRDQLAPEQYWEIFKKLRVGEVLEIAPVPVDDFLKEVPEPSDAELKAWFDEYKDVFANTSREDFTPGFKQPRKVDLQYLALRYEDVRQEVEKSKPVTDEEIEAYYEANKDLRYQVNELPTLDPLDPLKDGGEELFPPGTKPADEGDTEKPAGEQPTKEEPSDATPPAESTKPPAESPAEGDAGPKLDAPAENNSDEPAAEEPAAEEPAAEEPAAEEPAAEEPAAESAGDEQSSLSNGGPTDGTGSTIDESLTLVEFVQNPEEDNAAETAADEQPATEEPAAEDPAAEQSTSEEPATEEPANDEPAAAEAADDKPADSDAPSLPAPSEGDQPAADDAPPAAEGDKPAEGEDKKPAPKYRELDEALRDEIRTELINERTRAELNRWAEEIKSKMNDLSDDFISKLDDAVAVDSEEEEQERTEEQRREDMEKAAAELAPQAADVLKNLAKDYPATYASTGLISFRDLVQMGQTEDGAPATEDTIGDAVQAGQLGLPGQQRTSTAELAFGTELLYGPHDVVGAIKGDRFVFWKVQDRAEHVPATLADVREQVAESWKTNKARKLAEARAEELAKIADGKPLATSLPEGTPVGETMRFTWLYQPENVNPNPMTPRPRPTISEVAFEGLIDGEARVPVTDDAFMKKVFDELGVHDVGVVASGDLSAYYVVRIKERDPADPEIDGEVFMKENKFTHPFLQQFMSTPYDQMANYQQQMMVYQWAKDLRKSFDVKWVNSMKDRNVDE